MVTGGPPTEARSGRPSALPSSGHFPPGLSARRAGGLGDRSLRNLRNGARLGRRQRGYTLVEVMVTAAIIGVIALVGPRLFVQITRFVRLSLARTEVQRDARAALALMNRSLRQGKASTIRITSLSGQPPYSRIEFDKFLTSSTVRAMAFYQEGKTLYMVDPATHSICENLRYIAFTYPRTDDEDIVSVSLTLEKETYEGGAKSLQLSVEKVRIMND